MIIHHVFEGYKNMQMFVHIVDFSANKYDFDLQPNMTFDLSIYNQ